MCTSLYHLVSVCLSASSPSLPEVQCAPVLDGEWVKIGAMLLSKSVREYRHCLLGPVCHDWKEYKYSASVSECISLHCKFSNDPTELWVFPSPACL